MSAKKYGIRECRKFVKEHNTNLTDRQIEITAKIFMKNSKEFAYDLIHGTSKNKNEPVGIINYYSNRKKNKNERISLQY
jgi:hypothetical protein